MTVAKIAAMLSDASQSGVHHLPHNRRATLEAAANGLCVLHANLAKHKDVASLLAELGRALAFPDWYGGNFDALNDCLTDPDWQPGSGHVLFIDGLETLRIGDPQGFATLLEVFQAAAEERRAGGAPFWILLDTPSCGIPLLRS